jgi:hypothetical protein
MRSKSGSFPPAVEVFVDGRARIETKRIHREKAVRAAIVQEKTAEVCGARTERLFGFTRVPDDDVRPEGHVVVPAPVGDFEHLVEISLELSRLSDAAELSRIT